MTSFFPWESSSLETAFHTGMCRHVCIAHIACRSLTSVVDKRTILPQLVVQLIIGCLWCCKDKLEQADTTAHNHVSLRRRHTHIASRRPPADLGQTTRRACPNPRTSYSHTSSPLSHANLHTCTPVRIQARHCHKPTWFAVYTTTSGHKITSNQCFFDRLPCGVQEGVRSMQKQASIRIIVCLCVQQPNVRQSTSSLQRSITIFVTCSSFWCSTKSN